MKSTLKFAETFVGCGGSHIGFKNVGFKDIFVNDNNDTFIESFKLNNSSENCIVFSEPIEELAKRNILNIINLKKVSWICFLEV
jgi:DNA (cytosine-5)-methyltransferase 1